MTNFAGLKFSQSNLDYELGAAERFKVALNFISMPLTALWSWLKTAAIFLSVYTNGSSLMEDLNQGPCSGLANALCMILCKNMLPFPTLPIANIPQNQMKTKTSLKGYLTWAVAECGDGTPLRKHGLHLSAVWGGRIQLGPLHFVPWKNEWN